MIQVIFTINGVEQIQIAVIECDEDLQWLIKTFKEEVLEQYPTATNIRLGQLSVGIGN